MDKLIYLASPYTSLFKHETERRVRQVQDATARLIGQGFLIFSPIVNSHPIADLVGFSALNTPGAMSPWMQYDKAMIDRCDELWVLCIDGWDKSLGVEAEFQHALKAGKSIRFVEYPTLNRTGTVEITIEEALEIFDELIEAEVEKPVTQYGAGSVYSPASSGRPPFFTEQTHTTYAPIDDPDHPDNAFLPPTFNTQCAECDKPLEITEVTCGECNGTEHQGSLPDDAEARNGYPMADGVLYYFPNALAEVSRISKAGNDQHNPGQPMHWSRGKSTDHANKIIRHLVDAGHDTEGSITHAANLAWRALALLQEKIETVRGVPLPKNVWVDTNE